MRQRKLLSERFIVLACHNSAQLLFFSKKIYVEQNFEIDENVFIFKRMRLRENCWGKDLLFSPNST